MPSFRLFQRDRALALLQRVNVRSIGPNNCVVTELGIASHTGDEIIGLAIVADTSNSKATAIVIGGGKPFSQIATPAVEGTVAENAIDSKGSR